MNDLSLRDEVLGGLGAERKSLPPKLLYDDRGTVLFERICTLPEYYLTRAELEILRVRARAIADLSGPGCTLIEYGSGSASKARTLLDALDDPARYVPVDLARRQLMDVASSLARAYPTVAVRPICADYSRRVQIPDRPREGRMIGFFAGSSIGNFHFPDATSFLRNVRDTVGTDGAVVLGVDRLKDPRVLHEAYNDAGGITAEFNRNVLARLNRELGATFDLEHFQHVAFFNPHERRVEMHLESTRAQEVEIAGARIRFARGETIWTESSYKHDLESLQMLVSAGGLEIARLWTDERRQFWVVYLVPRYSPRGCQSDPSAVGMAPT